ncbi:hypothetical protein [Halostagnicola kamekurae]|uniref:Uncharacterized protein n=1 Tax=Halostagnicola kamekurae TaxID=619731 RepID=A0A1I6PGM2_9EURY|nr:hypothetical protein [Halostagnicola kamekurae]SFS39354.1 hypothetical protein SAMN04488556_0543 [Halostagnicola kamekurae]
MHRRAFLATATITPLAGCGSVLGGSGVDATLDDETRAEFRADEGTELTATVDVREIAETGEGMDEDPDVERDSIGFQIQHEEEGPIETWSVEDSGTFDVTVENSGTHYAVVMSGTADVTIEW